MKKKPSQRGRRIKPVSKSIQAAEDGVSSAQSAYARLLCRVDPGAKKKK